MVTQFTKNVNIMVCKAEAGYIRLGFEIGHRHFAQMESVTARGKMPFSKTAGMVGW